MTDRTAATAGFVLAGVASAAAFLGWPRWEVSLALAAFALAAFALRRYGRLERRVGAAIAGVAALGAAGGGAAGLWLGDFPPGAAVTAAGGMGAAIAAYSDWLGMERDAILERARLASLGGFLGLAGIVMLFVWQIVLLVFIMLFVSGELSPQMETALSTLTLGAGTLTVAAVYIVWSKRDWSFVDLRWPTLRHVGYALGGILGVFGANISIALLFQELEVESATHSVVETARTTGEPEMLLVLIPLSYLVIAPGEELLYRNVIQKTLRETFSPVVGVGVASVIFALVHFPAYMNPNLLATLRTLVVIFVMAMVLGAIYERTQNLVVPIIVHGTFNAIAFAATYADLTGMAG